MLFSVERDSSQNLVPLGCHGFDVGDISVVCEVESMAEHRVEDARGTFKTQSPKCWTGQDCVDTGQAHAKGIVATAVSFIKHLAIYPWIEP